MSSNLTDNSTTDPMNQVGQADQGHLAPADLGEPMNVETARQVEDKKLTRRAALRKLGYGAGFAAFSLLGVDDLARLVGQRLERLSGDSKVAQAVAQEFQQAGIALANPIAMATPTGPSLPSDCTGATVGTWCYNRYTAQSDRLACCRGTLGSDGHCSGATSGAVSTCINYNTSTCTGNWCWSHSSASGGDSHLTNCQALCGTVCAPSATATSDCADQCSNNANGPSGNPGTEP